MDEGMVTLSLACYGQLVKMLIYFGSNVAYVCAEIWQKISYGSDNQNLADVKLDLCSRFS